MSSLSTTTLKPGKAKKMLDDGTVRGKPITDKQRRFFGAVYSGGISKARKKQAGEMLSRRG